MRQPFPLGEAETWVFDLDNTLYDAATNLFQQVDVRMKEFIARFLDVDLDEAHRVQKLYFREFGTTLRGLMTRHDLDPGPYLDHVHDIDLSVIPPSPALDAALARLPGRKIIFTNASTAHADRVMARLGIAHHFEGVFDIVAADYVPKPEPGIYGAMVKHHGFDPRRAVMVEDIARNLEPAAALGMTTAWVRTDSHWGLPDEGLGDYVDHVVEDLVGWLERV